MMRYPSPGVYREERGPPPEAGLATGVCALIGGSTAGPFETPTQLLRRDSFPATFGASTPGGFLAEAVAGFFANGGARCYVVRAELTRPDWLDRALRSLGDSDDVDLVVAPDIALAPARQARSLQRALLDHCEADGGRFAILDAPPDEGLE
ncbi:MAG: phage tail sheath family protein, partial [Chloroflexales bacterium]|nr:phage tail sheath family protein [Chloroflexales bacterium]